MESSFKRPLSRFGGGKVAEFRAHEGAEHVMVEGDNLLALKALLPKYGGKVKCIYIDPPYNTGNEGWVYNDKVNSPTIRSWLGKTVDKDDLTRHDKWLCMMVPRLQVATGIVGGEGVIFMSIDDNEVHNLRAIMDKIFGEENFKQLLLGKQCQSGKTQEAAKMYEYILYARV